MSEWKLVPVEPTREMLDAGCEIDARAVALAELEAEYKQAGLTYPSAVVPAGRYLSVQYRAMLDAAPPPAADAVSVDALMEMAQEYASAWSLVGGPFDRGDMLDDAADAKERLRRAIAAALAARSGR